MPTENGFPKFIYKGDNYNIKDIIARAETTELESQLNSLVESLGTLAYTDSASATYTPKGNVSQPTTTLTPVVDANGDLTFTAVTSTPVFTGEQDVITTTAAGKLPATVGLLNEEAVIGTLTEEV